jgi:hypothetical protein
MTYRLDKPDRSRERCQGVGVAGVHHPIVNVVHQDRVIEATSLGRPAATVMSSHPFKRGSATTGGRSRFAMVVPPDRRPATALPRSNAPVRGVVVPRCGFGSDSCGTNAPGPDSVGLHLARRLQPSCDLELGGEAHTRVPSDYFIFTGSIDRAWRRPEPTDAHRRAPPPDVARPLSRPLTSRRSRRPAPPIGSRGAWPPRDRPRRP